MLTPLVVFLFVRPSLASFNQFSAGYGVLNSGILTESVTDEGKSSLYGSFTYNFLTMGLRWGIGRYHFGLRGGYTVLPRTTQDGAAEVTNALGSLYLGIPLDDVQLWTLNVGAGVLYTESQGQGGTIAIINGGSASTAALPDTTTKSQTINIEVGVVYEVSDQFQISGDLLLNGILSNKRNGSLFLNLTYFWAPSSGGSNAGRYYR